MNNIIITTDSGCDLGTDKLTELGIKVIPLTYTLNGKTYYNNPDHSEYPVQDFYRDIKAGASVSTSAVNVGEFIDFFSSILKQGTDLVYISLSSGISATYQNALNAAEDLKEEFPDRKIAIIDSLCASMGEGLLAYMAAKKATEDISFDELVSYLEEIKHKVCHEFTVDDLGQLKRGGRISPAVAFVGSMLQIKPILYVNPQGKLVNYNKVRGRRMSVSKLVETIVSESADEKQTPIFISHGDCEDEAVEAASMIKAAMPDKEIYINHIGPVIGAHAGYKTLAIFTIGNNRGENRD